VTVSAPQETAYYVYGVVPRDQGLPPLEGVGLDVEFAPELIASGPLAAVASRIRVRSAEPVELDAEDAVARVLAHEAVLERVLETAEAVVPFRFGSACAEEADVVALLEAREEELVEALARLAGRVELGVKAYVDPVRVADAVCDGDDELAALRAEIASVGEGTAHLRRKQLDHRIAESAALERARVATALHRRLAATAVASCTNPLPEAASGLQPVINGAYLVERTDEGAFRRGAADAAAEHGAFGLRIDVTGPWPAYNFVGVDG